MSESEMKKLLLDRYTKVIDEMGKFACQTLDAYQDIAREFGWKDVLDNMQKQARDKL